MLAAPQGIGNDTDNSLELSGGVNIANGTAVLMTTDTMLINSDDRIAKSGGEVVLKTEKSETTADGLIINLSTNTATLAGNVSTEYRTERSP
jgi:LPS export ABC transporter protein LptC